MDQLFSEKWKLGSKKLLEGSVQFSYADLEKRCMQLNAYLATIGLRAGDRICIATTEEAEAAAVTLVCMRLGFPVALMDTGAKQNEISQILGNLQPKALFLDQSLIEAWSEVEALQNGSLLIAVARTKKKLLNRLLSRKEESAMQAYPDCLGMEAELSAKPDVDPALFLCTSGTTGLPKILQLSDSNLMAAAKTTSRKLELDGDARVLNLLPLTHYDGVVSGLFTAFYTGATQIRLGPFSLSLMPDVFDAIYKYRATHVLLTPSILALMLRLGEEMEEAFRSPDFRFVISVAATLPPKLWSDFQQKTGKKIVNVYGLSETGNNLFAGPDDNSYKIGAIGMPVDCKALIINKSGSVAAPGEVGELLLQGASITSSYVGETISTVEVAGSKWFATGDLAQVDEEGVYWLAGRQKNIIIVGGRNVYPDEINNALLTHPGIVEVATVGVPDEIWGERVVSCVVARPDVRESDVLHHAGQKLTDYKIPREVFLLPELPRGRSGKVLINELVQKIVSGALTKSAAQAERVEDRILRLAAESFRMQPTDLSLATAPANCSRWDSVAHMDLVVNVEKNFSIELLPREVIRMTSLDAVSQIVREKLAER